MAVLTLSPPLSHNGTKIIVVHDFWNTHSVVSCVIALPMGTAFNPLADENIFKVDGLEYRAYSYRYRSVGGQLVYNILLFPIGLGKKDEVVRYNRGQSISGNSKLELFSDLYRDKKTELQIGLEFNEAIAVNTAYTGFYKPIALQKIRHDIFTDIDKSDPTKIDYGKNAFLYVNGNELCSATLRKLFSSSANIDEWKTKAGKTDYGIDVQFVDQSDLTNYTLNFYSNVTSKYSFFVKYFFDRLVTIKSNISFVPFIAYKMPSSLPAPFGNSKMLLIRSLYDSSKTGYPFEYTFGSSSKYQL